MTIIFDEKKHTYLVDGIYFPSVTTIIKEFCPMSEYIDPYYLERGRQVHLACQLCDQYKLSSMTFSEEVMKFLKAYKNFLDMFVPSWRAIEECVYSETYRFAGTLDRRGKMLGREVIIDIKTASAPPSACIQTAAYNLCHGKMYDRYTLELHADGTFKLDEHKDYSDHGVFLAMLNVYNWKRSKNGISK